MNQDRLRKLSKRTRRSFAKSRDPRRVTRLSRKFRALEAESFIERIEGVN